MPQKTQVAPDLCGLSSSNDETLGGNGAKVDITVVRSGTQK